MYYVIVNKTHIMKLGKLHLEPGKCLVFINNHVHSATMQLFTIFAAISSSMALAAATPLGSPSMRIMSLLSSSGGMMMDVPVSVLMRFTKEE